MFLGKAGLTSVTPGDLDRKFSVLASYLDAVVVAAARPGLSRRSGVRTVGVPAPVFYACGPPIALAVATRRGSAVTCQSPFEALPALVLSRLLPRRVRPAIAVEVRGDWRTATRLYGSPLRRVVQPVADRGATWAVAHADVVRTIGEYTERLARQAGYRGVALPLTTFSDFGQFIEAAPCPLPQRPQVVYVGALEPTKGVDVLLSAWPAVAERVPGAQLVIAGDGSRRSALEAMAARLGPETNVRFAGRLPRPAVARLLDESALLVLPSRSEGLGRIVMEAHARARPAVGTAVGGIPEQIVDGETGVLVPPDDPAALATAVAGLLADHDRMRTMGDNARARLLERDPVGAYHRHVADLARWIEARRAAQ
ncbi:MAG: glycosyltransferase family 4 protein [Acidimicrobiia bacterium]